MGKCAVEVAGRRIDIAVCHMKLGQSREVVAGVGEALCFLQMLLGRRKLPSHQCSYESELVEGRHLHGNVFVLLG